MEQLLVEFEERANLLNEAIDGAIDALAGIPARYRVWTSSTGWDADAILARSRLIVDLARGLASSPKDRLMFAPTSRLIAVRDTADNIIAQTNNLAEQLRNIASWGGATSSDKAVLSAANGNTVQARQLLDNLWSAQDSTLDAYLLVAPAIFPRGLGKFAAASRKVEEAAVSANEMLNDLTGKAVALAATIEAVQARTGEADNGAEEVQRLLNEVEGRRKGTEEQAASIAAALATVEEFRSRAAVLRGQVDELEPKLMSFDENLASREKAHTDSLGKLSAATEGMTTARTELAQIIQDAKDVLGQATVAGLSREYANQATAINGQLTKARWAYYLSVGLLVLSVMLALGLLPFWIASPLRPIPEWRLGTPTGAYVVQLLGALGSRILVILPAGLLAAFASTRHAALFRLREEYNHKKGLAASIDGFKAQAPDYAEAMAAAVFQELVKNPALAIDGNADHSPNGYLAKILEPRVREALATMLAAGGVLAADKDKSKE